MNSFLFMLSSLRDEVRSILNESNKIVLTIIFCDILCTKIWFISLQLSISLIKVNKVKTYRENYLIPRNPM